MNSEGDFYDLLVEVEEGNPQAQYEWGIMQILSMGLKQDTQAGVNLLVEASTAGHTKARAELESCWFYADDHVGTGTLEWLALSSRQDDPSAFDYYLAFFFHMGIMFERNDEQAASHLLHAAELSNRDAQFHIARFYQNGIGLTYNLEKAKSWYAAAAAQGHKLAVEILRGISSTVDC